MAEWSAATPTVADAEPTWTAAERAAVANRWRRTHPAPRSRRRVDRALLVTAVVAWIAATAIAIGGFTARGDAHTAVGVVGLGAMFGSAVLGLVWAGRTGALMLRGSPASVQAALPAGARRSVRRQLAGREPVDPAHREVVVELAHQQRRQLRGQLVYVAFYVPYSINWSQGRSDWGHVALSVAAALVLVVLAVSVVVVHRRCSAVISGRR